MELDGSVKDNLSHLKKVKATQGELKDEGLKNILVQALIKEEHPGRVRDVGLGVTPKSYFPELRKPASDTILQEQVAIL